MILARIAGSFMPPNSAANANFLQQLRYILVQDYDLDDDGREETLRLAYATPRAWLAPGKRISVKNAPTAFGPLSYELSREGDRIKVEINLPPRQPSAVRLRLRCPDHTEEIDLTGRSGHVSLFAKVGK